MALDPVVGFFVLGMVAGLLRSDLKLSGGLSDTLSIYLLIAIGLKGGIELSSAPVGSLVRKYSVNPCGGVTRRGRSGSSLAADRARCP